MNFRDLLENEQFVEENVDLEYEDFNDPADERVAPYLNDEDERFLDNFQVEVVYEVERGMESPTRFEPDDDDEYTIKSVIFNKIDIKELMTSEWEDWFIKEMAEKDASGFNDE